MGFDAESLAEEYKQEILGGLGRVALAKKANIKESQARRVIALIKEPKQKRVPVIVGLKPDDFNPEIDNLWQAAFNAQDAVWQFEAKRQEQRVTLDKEPVVLAIVSDLHFGGKGVDYRSAKRDAELIQHYDYVYGIYVGDGINNWIIGKLTALNSTEALGVDASWHLLRDYLEHLKDKLIVTVAGNHDNWTIKLAQIDFLREIVKSYDTLYDPYEVVFTLDVGGFEQVIKVRHKWKGSSIYNPTHGIEVGFDRGDTPFDIGIGGHTHSGTVIRPFYRHKKKRLAVLAGAYKRFDSYAKEIGFPSTPTNGCGALLITPEGVVQPFESIETAILARAAL